MKEMGELAKATRKVLGMKLAEAARQTELKEELVVVNIASALGVVEC